MAYRAEIEIGVKGAERLAAFQKKLLDVNKILEVTNKTRDIFEMPLANLQNYTKNLKEAARALQLVEVGTEEETKAIQSYVRAAGEAAAVRDRQNRLMDEEAAKLGLLTQKLKEYNAAQVPPTPRGSATTMAGAYLRGQPKIGPELPPDFNPVAAAGRARASGLAAAAITEGRKAQEAIKIINEVTEHQRRAFIDITNTKIQLTQKQLDAELDSIQTALDAAIKADKAKQADFDRRLSARTKSNTDAENIYLKIREDSEKRIEAQRRAGLQRAKKLEQDIAKEREARARRRQEAVGSAIIGGGFPLLFGQGPGAALGGALGGGAGGLIGGQFGFGLSLIGTQLGTTVDQFIQSTAELGQALNPLTADLDALAEAAGFAGTETAAAIQTIKQLGSEQQALEAATLLLAATVGQDGVNALRDFGDDTADLGREFARTMSLMQAASAGFFGSVTSFVGNVLEQANDLAAGINLDTPEAKELQARRAEILQGSATSAIGASGAAASSSIAAKSGELTQIENRLRELARERRLEAEGIVVAQAQELKDKAFLEKFGIKSAALTKVENQLAAQKRDFTNDNYVSLLKQEALEQKNIANARAMSEAEKDKNGQIKNYRLLAEATNQNEIKFNNTLLEIDRQRDEALESRSKKQARLSQQGLKQQQTALDLVQRLRAQEQLTEVGSGAEAQRLQIQIQYLRTLETINRLKNQDYAAELQALALSIRTNQEANLQAKLERDRTAALKQAVAPLVSIREQQIQSIEKTKEYNRLIAEGVLPSEAKRIAAFNTQATLLVKQVEEKIKLVEVELLSLDANDGKTKELKRQLQLLKDQKKAIEGEASKGPGKAAPEATPADIIREQIGTLQEELNAMTNLGNIAVNVANSIGSAFSTAFQDVVSGSKSVQEGLADMFKSVAADFLKMAADIIAKQLMMIALQALLKALGGPGGGGGGGGASSVPSSAYGDMSVAGPSFFTPKAEGGFVTGPTPALVGEGGEAEYIIPESKMRESMSRYSRGARGSAVIPEAGGSGTSGEGGGTAVAAPIDVRYTVERINSVDYVTADQFQAGMRQAASQGAKQGEQQTLRRLQMSGSTRKRVGM